MCSCVYLYEKCKGESALIYFVILKDRYTRQSAYLFPTDIVDFSVLHQSAECESVYTWYQ